MLPLDAHAHVEPGIDPEQLVGLRSCVIAVTRTADEFDIARRRRDPTVVWGVGCHPGLTRAVRSFSPSRMKEALADTPIIGEIGLDGSVRTPMDQQLVALRQIFEVASEMPRVLSIHSYRATDLLLSELRHHRPKGTVLHWWLGTRAETEEAIELGASFSVNASQAKRWESLALVPAERLLLETDHPFGDRAEKPPRQPGHLSKPEAAVSSRLGISDGDLRALTWRNLRRLADEMHLIDMFPTQFQIQFLAA